jgi:hypothetical protein
MIWIGLLQSIILTLKLKVVFDKMSHICVGPDQRSKNIIKKAAKCITKFVKNSKFMFNQWKDTLIKQYLS